MATTTPTGLREHWRSLRRGRPGHRFQGRYERARRQERKAGLGQRILFLVAGLLALGLGILLVVFPGPVLPFFFLAGALFAGESLIVAKAMDAAEVRLRKAAVWARRIWQRLPSAARVGLMIVGACCSAASAYFSYRMMRG